MSKYKTIDFYAKCNDMFYATLTDKNGNETEHDGYPFLFLGDGNGVSLNIDLETGQILNWKKPTNDDFKLDEDEEDDDYPYLNSTKPDFEIDDEDAFQKVIKENNEKHTEKINNAFRKKFGLAEETDLSELLKNERAKKAYDLFYSSGDYRKFC